MLRIGFGSDTHRLETGRQLWLGGVPIPHDKGGAGHSDADTLIHAIIDALLGAAGLRDIGFHFPDNAAEFKGIDSKILLTRTIKLIAEKGYSVSNIDTTISLERPKISEFIPAMVSTLAEVMGIDPDRISVKAKTGEKIGFIGREEGVSATAVVLLHKSEI